MRDHIARTIKLASEQAPDLERQATVFADEVRQRERAVAAAALPTWCTSPSSSERRAMGDERIPRCAKKAQQLSLAVTELRGSREALDAAMMRVAGLNDDVGLFTDLPAGFASQITDVDGKFSVTLPTGKYAIAAQSKRLMDNMPINLTWLVWAEVAGPVTAIQLANHNLTASENCTSCIHLIGR